MELEGHSFIEPLDDEEVVLQVAISIGLGPVLRHRTVVDLFFDKQEDATVVGQFVLGVARQAGNQG